MWPGQTSVPWGFSKTTLCGSDCHLSSLWALEHHKVNQWSIIKLINWANRFHTWKQFFIEKRCRLSIKYHLTCTIATSWPPQRGVSIAGICVEATWSLLCHINQIWQTECCFRVAHECFGLFDFGSSHSQYQNNLELFLWSVMNIRYKNLSYKNNLELFFMISSEQYQTVENIRLSQEAYHHLSDYCTQPRAVLTLWVDVIMTEIEYKKECGLLLACEVLHQDDPLWRLWYTASTCAECGPLFSRRICRGTIPMGKLILNRWNSNSQISHHHHKIFLAGLYKRVVSLSAISFLKFNVTCKAKLIWCCLLLQMKLCYVQVH